MHATGCLTNQPEHKDVRAFNLAVARIYFNPRARSRWDTPRANGRLCLQRLDVGRIASTDAKAAAGKVGAAGSQQRQSHHRSDFRRAAIGHPNIAIGFTELDHSSAAVLG